jgi:hypothetical protein
MKNRTLLGLPLLLAGLQAHAQVPQADTTLKKSLDIYGHVMMDMGYNAGASNGAWYDVMRPSQLPGFKDQYGSEGNAYFSVRQTRFGAKSYTQTPLGELFTQFEFEMFGTGVDAGQTTFRLRHAYGQLGKWGAGQYWSPFMDIDVFPNTLEYWGPNSMVFFRNIQLRYMPIQGDTKLTFALERPGASSDQGSYRSDLEQQDLNARFPLPDLSFEYRKATGFGYVELAGIVRNMEWEDLDTNSVDLSGSALGWGLNLSTNINIGKKSTVRAQFVYGQGIQNYLNDASADIGVRENVGNTTKPFEGYALPVYGGLIFLDHKWSDKMSSSIGYSMLDQDLAISSDSSSFKTGGYAAANVLFYPAPNMMWGIEYQYGSRENFKDGYSYNASKVQVSFKYYFGQTFYRRTNG